MGVIGLATADWSTFTDERGHRTFGGSGWYRIGMPAQALTEHGHDVTVGQLCRRGDLLGVQPWGEGAEPAWPDLVIVQRYMHAELPEAIGRARSVGQVVVQDVDDWFWGLHTSNRAFHAMHSSDEVNLSSYTASLAASDLLTVSTSFLAERLRKLNPNVVVVPNAIDLARWRSAVPGDFPRVGWVGAVPWRSNDLETLRGVIGPWLHRSGWGFHHSGHVDGPTPAWTRAGVPPADEDPRRGVPVTTLPMAPIHLYPQLFNGFRVGLAPLADLPFNTAKSWVKLTEYAAASIPAVVSDMPAYREAHESYGLGFLARRPKDWLRWLDYLREAWEEEGARARDLVAPLDIEHRWVEWRDAYDTVASTRAAS